MTDDDLFAGVRACVAEALDIDEADIRPESRLIDDLGADSLDFLDLLFHLEARFQVRLKPRSIEKLARNRLGGAALEVNGVFTPEALRELRLLLPEIPIGELSDGMRSAELPRRFRVATFMALVRRAKAGELPHE
jgi:acyl carrier protein